MAKKEEKTKEQKKTEQSQSPNKGKSKAPQPLPFLLDFSFSVASLVILFTGVLTVVLSLLNGASLVMAAVRGCVAVFGLGALFWLLNYFLANQMLQVAIHDLKGTRSKPEEGESTREFHA
ncbi:MAG: hypothetical protein N3D16_01425 [Anaerolineales bacterium]|nr:hypothetical protein [Anaerolineales bacterium]